MADNQESRDSSGVESAAIPNQFGDEAPNMAPAKRTPSPAFQFYAAKFLLSPKVQAMSATERGIYISLLCQQWIDGSLPTDFAELAPIANVKASQLERMWPKHLAKCFEDRKGCFVNPKLEDVRRQQIAWRNQQAEHGKAGGRPTKGSKRVAFRKPKATQSSNTTTTTDSSTERESTRKIEECWSLAFVTVGEPSSWLLTDDRISEWATTYPNLDVRAECLKASAWLNANTSRRKTASGMPRFLVNWLNNAVNRGSGPRLAATGTDGRGRTGAPPRGKYDGIEEHD